MNVLGKKTLGGYLVIYLLFMLSQPVSLVGQSVPPLIGGLESGSYPECMGEDTRLTLSRVSAAQL